MKVVINRCYGGFSVSRKAQERLLELKCPHTKKVDKYGNDHAPLVAVRSCPQLVQVVEELGPEANGSMAELKVIEVPDGTECHIDDYDGVEHVAENHETWS